MRDSSLCRRFIAGGGMVLALLSLTVVEAHGEKLVIPGEYVVMTSEEPVGFSGRALRGERPSLRVRRVRTRLDRRGPSPYRRDDDECDRIRRELDGVVSCEPNHIVTIHAAPSDTFFARQWGFENPNGIDIGAEEAWVKQTGSPAKVVAILDTGIDIAHPDLVPNLWTNQREIPANGVDDDANGYVDDIHGFDFAADDGNPADENGHGTHCAGIIGAATNNLIGVSGINWNVRLMAVRFLNAGGSGTLADVIAGLTYVLEQKRRGVDIVAINASYGSPAPSPAEQAVLRQLADAGVLLVAAAGNAAADNDTGANFPSNYDLPNVIAVAALDSQGNLASFSNYGAASVDIAAPGVNIISTVPGGYAFLSGTSMAAPHVAGAVALLAAHAPELDMASRRIRLLASAKRLATLQGAVAGARFMNLSRMIDGLTDATDPGDVTAAPGGPAPNPPASGERFSITASSARSMRRAVTKTRVFLNLEGSGTSAKVRLRVGGRMCPQAKEVAVPGSTMLVGRFPHVDRSSLVEFSAVTMDGVTTSTDVMTLIRSRGGRRLGRDALCERFMRRLRYVF